MDVNGRASEIEVEPRRLLADALRDDLQLMGTTLGCGHGVCGSCTVLIDGVAQRSCLVLAVQCGRLRDHHRRRPRPARRQPASAATGLHRPARAAVRVLHARLPDACGRGARPEPRSRSGRRGADRRAVVQPVPVHRLCRDQGCGQASSSRDARVDSLVASVITPPVLDQRQHAPRTIPAGRWVTRQQR